MQDSDLLKNQNEVFKMKNYSHYILLSKLFEYPKHSLKDAAIELQKLVIHDFPQLIIKTEKFVTAIQELSIHEQQEYYMKTFDVKAIIALDLGYLIFGEDYKRAEILVNLQKEHQKAGIDCGTELGDHLPNILQLIAKTQDEEFREELGFIITRPCIRFMLTKFKNHENYYEHLLEILSAILQADFDSDQLKEYEFAEERFDVKNEFIMPSPKAEICQSNCKHKRN